MKTLPAVRSAAALPFFALAIATVSPVAGAEPAASPKDHSLFVGQNITVFVKGDYLPVVGAGRRSFIVDDHGQTREIRTDRAKAVRVNRGLKLSTLTASITRLDVSTSSDRAAAEQLQAMQNAIAVQDESADRQDYLQGQAMREEQWASFGDTFVSLDLPAAVRQQIRSDFKTALVQRANAEFATKMIEGQAATDRLQTLGNDGLMGSMRIHANDGEGVELLPEITLQGVRLSIAGAAPSPSGPSQSGAGGPGALPDAVTQSQIALPGLPAPAPRRTIVDHGNGASDRIDMDFQLATPEPVDDAYLIVSTEYMVPGKLEQFRRVLAQKIGHLGPTPRRISLYQTDFPTGFHVNDYTISVYAHGQELATNLSPERLDLSREEAYQYVLADYLASHKGESRPPAAVLMAPRSALKQMTPGPDFNSPIYVTVNSDGTVRSISSEAGAPHAISPDLQRALENFRFIPALDKGVPAAGRAKLVVADFTR